MQPGLSRETPITILTTSESNEDSDCECKVVQEEGSPLKVLKRKKYR